MPRTPPSLALPLLLLVACAHQPPPPSHHGDIHEGPCRVDADCPQGERCIESRAHLWTSDGEIVGDLVTHRCEAPAPADASTGDSAEALGSGADHPKAGFTANVNAEVDPSL